MPSPPDRPGPSPAPAPAPAQAPPPAPAPAPAQARRDLRFDDLDAIVADAGRFARGPVCTTGGWSAAQIVAHVADAIHGSMDGFAVRAPEAVRRRARARVDAILASGIPAGVVLPPEMAEYVPPPETTLDAALARLRTGVARVATEPMTAEHPFFGALTQMQWLAYHCRHAELHFSFVHPAEPPV